MQKTNLAAIRQEIKQVDEEHKKDHHLKKYVTFRNAAFFNSFFLEQHPKELWLNFPTEQDGMTFSCWLSLEEKSIVILDGAILMVYQFRQLEKMLSTINAMASDLKADQSGLNFLKEIKKVVRISDEK